MHYSKKGYNYTGRKGKSFFDPMDFGHFFHDVFGGTVADMVKSEMVSTRPKMNVVETPDNYRLELTVPGLTKEDIKIKLEKNILKIFAERTNELPEGEKYNRKEYDYNMFKRSFELPNKVDTKAIKANVKNGILVITLGKIEKQDARDINID